MTYTTLQQVSTPETSIFKDPYVPTGTDGAEFVQWRHNLGDTEVEYDPSDELRELGLK